MQNESLSIKQKLRTVPSEPLKIAFQRIIFACVACMWLFLLWEFQPLDGVGTDFYPMHAALASVMQDQNPYGSAFNANVRVLWQSFHYPFFGFVYPLPALIGLWPILVLPFPIALLVWRSFGAIGPFAAIRLRENWQSLALLPLSFVAFHRALTINQPTLIWFTLSVLLLFSIRWRWSWLAGYCIVLLPCKPQTGLIFAIAGVIWAWQQDKRTLGWVGVWGILIWGGSFIIQPDWVQSWLTLTLSYTSSAYTPSVFPWALILLPLTWRLPRYAAVAVLQVVLFPITDIYSTLPLMLVWVAIGGPLALVGSAVSWLWIFLHLPNTITFFWLFLLMPLMIALAWRLYYSHLHTMLVANAVSKK